MKLARDVFRLDDLPGREVGTADIAHLALADEIVERAQRLVDRRHSIGAVELVEIDPVGAQPSQGVLDGRHDPASRAALAVQILVQHRAEFGRKHDVLPPRAEDLADELLGAAAFAHRRITVRGIEERDADLDRLVDHGAGFFAAAATGEIVAPKADHRDFQTTAGNRPSFHVKAPPIKPHPELVEGRRKPHASTGSP
jgi:hypothetical protein